MSGAEKRARFPTARTLKVDDLLQVYDGIIDEADAVLKESQIAGPLPIPAIPEGVESYLRWTDHQDPLPPDDITDIGDLQLGKMFSLFQNWTNYVAAEVTRAKCMKEVQERNLKVVKSALTLHYRDEGTSTTVLDDKVNCDSRYVEVDAGLLRMKVFYETAKSREDQLRRTLNNISREQTRRQNELERQLHDERGGYQRGRGGEDSPFGRGSGPGDRPRSFKR